MSSLLRKAAAKRGFACGALLICALSFAHSKAQTDGAGIPYVPHLAFDVVSIREARDGDWSYYDNDPHTSYWHAERLTVQGLILGAYNLQFLQLPDLPNWAKDKRFNLTARSDDATDQVLAKLSDKNAEAVKQQMVQQMLADRFKLRIHPVTRVATVYHLVSTPFAAKRLTPLPRGLDTDWSSCTPRFGEDVIEIVSKGCPIPLLVSLLQAEVPDEIIDQTGLKDRYAFRVYWRFPARNMTSPSQYPEMRDAIREQLGLELKPDKGPVTFYVVDHIEEPSPN